MGLSDPVKVFVGVAPSPALATESAAVAKQIQFTMMGAMTGMTGVTRGWAASMGASLASVGAMFKGSFIMPMVGLAAGMAGFSAVKAGISEMVGTGISFNSTIENVTIGIAAMMRQMEPAKFTSFNLAMLGSAEIVKGIKKEALTTAATFEDLAQSTQGLIGPMLRSGIPLAQVPAASGMLSRAVSAVMPWARSGQFIQEGRALLTGDINQNAFLARALNITRQQVLEAQRAGRMMEFLRERLYAFNEAAERVMGTQTGLRSNLSDVWMDVMGDLTRTMYTDLKAFTGDMIAWIKTDDFKNGARAIIDMVQAIARAGASLAKMGFGVAGQVGNLAAGAPEFEGDGFFKNIGRAAGAGAAPELWTQTVTGLLTKILTVQTSMDGKLSGPIKTEDEGLKGL